MRVPPSAGAISEVKMQAFRQYQRGATLIEALIGFLVLTAGVLGAARLQSWLQLNSDIAVQRVEAIHLAQQDLEQLRALADSDAFQSIAPRRSTQKATSTTFTLTRQVSRASTDAPLKTGTVSVSWLDRSGSPQTIRLASSLSGLSAKYSAALALPSQDQVLAPRRLLPPGARMLDHGRSLFKPSARSSVAWLIDNASGMVTAQCSISAAQALNDIDEANPTHCTKLIGHLRSGYIRFSLGAVPDAVQANDAPLPLSLSVAPENASRCELEASTGPQRYLAYSCVVPQGSAEPLRITPEGWAFGDTAATFKACRYSSAPETFARQNYLIIRGDTACPGAPTPHNGVSVATVPYQP